MDDLELALYSRYTQKYIEIFDEFRGYEQEKAEFEDEGQEVPVRILEQFMIYKIKVENMILEAYNRWNKGHDDLYRDGWKFWMKEDAELREKRYGTK
jgi:hypothetical protein